MNFHVGNGHEVFSVNTSEKVAMVMADLLSPGGYHPVQMETIGYGDNQERVIEVAPDVTTMSFHALAQAAGVKVESHREPDSRPVAE
jgi:hypothetical protein